MKQQQQQKNYRDFIRNRWRIKNRNSPSQENKYAEWGNKSVL